MINCEIYREGMCVYIPKNLSKEMTIVQKCSCELYPKDMQERISEKCTMKNTIRKLKERDQVLELKVQ